MRAVLCRVFDASVSVDANVVGRIGPGLLVYVGVIDGDGLDAAAWLAGKIAALRVFSDDAGRMNRSVVDVGGAVLAIPNFTLAGRSRKGTRPSFTDAAAPQQASELFDLFARHLRRSVDVQTGVFGASMQITSTADGPVTIVVDS